MSRTESQEMYLETILVLSKKKPVVRAVDIAAEMNVSKASVSLATKNLKEMSYITVTPEGYIYLSETGMEIAGTIYERHLAITKVLTQIGVPADVAEQDACRIEHVISEITFDAIKKHSGL